MTDAREVTLALRGRWYRSYGVAPCPVCQPERKRDQNALTLRDGECGLLAHCKKSGCDFRDILSAAGVSGGDYRSPDPFKTAQREAEERARAKKREVQAEQVWQEARPIVGTVAETYLRGRGITCPLPGSLRFHPAAWHGPTSRNYRAMVARIEGSKSFAVHRTYLDLNGLGKADIPNDKAMLGPAGGGAVRLSEGHGRLVVCEGIETGLSLLSGLLSDPATVWAALSTSGLRGLRLPPRPGHLTIACDGDPPGRAAAHDLATRANGLGWDVGIWNPGDGLDFNDILNGKAVAA
jgi:hypothetical protein